MEKPVILSACRTPIGKFNGALAKLTAVDLGAIAIRSACDRAGIDASDVDEVIMGNVLPAGLGQAPARQAALAGGLGDETAALTINKMCGSGLKAVMLAAQAIVAGDADVIVAGGMESMSRAPYLLPRTGAKLGDRTLIDSMMNDGLVCSLSGKGMGLIADQLAQRDGITREQQDRYACESHQRAVTAIEAGQFVREICPVTVGSVVVDRDQGPRADTDQRSLSTLPAAFDAAGSVTAGNASMISDGAAAVVVTSSRFASARGLSPIAQVLGSATAGTAPEDLFIAPVLAIKKVLQRCGLELSALDRIEINEAFAAQMLACSHRLELSTEHLNVRGGAIALGHPIGASGARVLTTLIHTLIDDNKHLGLASLCLGGGNAVAMIIANLRDPS